MPTPRLSRPVILLCVLLAVGLGAWLAYHLLRPAALVLYCAHDAHYSQQIIGQFERDTGIRVDIRFDTEATKSVGLAELIRAERQRPRCDVFWNNQLMTTADLAEDGLLEPYQGPGWQRIPAAMRDPAGRWTGFAGRLRVYIVNTRKLAATDEAIAQALAAPSQARVAVARPLFGTTLTHYALLHHLWGAEKLAAFHRDWRKRGVVEASGNASVMKAVARGECDLGWTDTDDFFEAKDDGAAVAMRPIRVGPGAEGGQVILIPNTVAIVKGTRRPAEAQKLVDYLLSAETELALAKSRARQIPLGAVDPAGLSAEVRELAEWAKDSHPLGGLLPAHRVVLAWLKAEYLK